MADNVTSDDRVMNRARMIEFNQHRVLGSPWLSTTGETIEEAAIKCARQYGYTQSVVEVERDGISHLIGVERVVTYRTTGLRGGDGVDDEQK